MKKCERCNGTVYHDGEELVCINCGARPLGYAPIDYNAWQWATTYYTDAEVGEGSMYPTSREFQRPRPLPIVPVRDLR